MAGRRGKKTLFWTGILIGASGSLGQHFARRMMTESPELYMGAALVGLFGSTAHLALHERVTLFFAYYGAHVALAGVVLAFIGLVRRR